MLMILWNRQEARTVLAAGCHASHPVQRELVAVENCLSLPLVFQRSFASYLRRLISSELSSKLTGGNPRVICNVLVY